MNGLIGRTLGQYQIVEQIGEGGMATVYKAYQPGLDRYVAVKVLPPIHAQQPGFTERFRREARAIANLHHPNILPVYEFGQEDDYSYIVMRYVDGARTLKAVMAEGVGLAKAADLIGQIAGALDHGHQRGIIHRDVKPSNVLMDGDWALLTDFGLAKMTEASVQLTGSGVGVGTPAYMSPEQGQGAPIDHRTDVYSLGIILFEMLTGQIPHNAETPFAIVLKRVTEPLPVPRDLNPDIPDAVQRVILKALARDRESRFASAQEMADALKRAVLEATPTQIGLGREEAAEKVTPEPMAPTVPGSVEVVAGTALAEPAEPERAVGQAPPEIASEPWEPPEGTGAPAEAASTEPGAQATPVRSEVPVAVPRRLPLGRAFPWKWVAGGGAVVAVVVLFAIGFGSGWWRQPEMTPTPRAAVLVPTATAPQSPSSTATQPATPTSVPADAALTVRMRVRVVSSSDWASVDLGTKGEISEQKTVEVGGEVNQAELDIRTIRLGQEIQRAEAGDTISMVQDLVLSGVPVEERMWFTVRKGCLGVTTVEVLNVVVDPPVLVERAFLPECNPEVFLLYPQVLVTDSPPPSPTPLPTPHPGLTYLESGISLTSEGQHERAFAELDQAIALGLESSDTYYWRGIACREWHFYEGGCSYEQAVADFTQAIEHDAEDVRLYVDRAWTYRLWGDYARSIADWSRAIELEPGNANHYFDRASVHRDRQYWDAALEDMDRAIELDPGNAPFWRERGWLNSDRGELAEAISDFESAIALDPQECLAYWGRALVYRRREQYRATLDDLDKAIEFCPNIGQLYIDRGWLYHDDLGDSEQALSDFSTAIDIEPEGTHFRFQRGRLYDLLGRVAEARADFRKYLELTEGDPNAEWREEAQRWLREHPE